MQIKQKKGTIYTTDDGCNFLTLREAIEHMASREFRQVMIDEGMEDDSTFTIKEIADYLFGNIRTSDEICKIVTRFVAAVKKA